jgi:hypothetical protein
MMSQPTARQTPRAGLNGHPLTTQEAAARDALDLCAAEDALLPEPGLPHEDHSPPAGRNGHAGHGEGADDASRLRLENSGLRQRLEEVEALLLERGASADWAERQREYEALLEEKSEVIRSLHLKLAELREAPPPPAPAPDPEPGADGLTAADRQELLSLKRELEQERAQLAQDEEALMQQMRVMEMAMSRERAELARQRTEIQRLHADLRHEIDQAARDSGLRERLAPLQRRQQEVSSRRAAPAPAPAPATDGQEGSAKKSSGLFRRLFGG